MSSSSNSESDLMGQAMHLGAFFAICGTIVISVLFLESIDDWFGRHGVTMLKVGIVAIVAITVVACAIGAIGAYQLRRSKR